MATYKIEKEIPVPRKRETGLLASMRLMQVGDSMFLAGRKVTYAAAAATRVQNAKFTSRTVDGGCRVWRIE